MDKVLDSFINENNNLFNEYYKDRALKKLENREDYVALKNKKNKILDIFPQIRSFIEDEEPADFGQKETSAFYEIVSICEEMKLLELKEAFKLGAREAYIFFKEQDMLNI